MDPQVLTRPDVIVLLVCLTLLVVGVICYLVGITALAYLGRRLVEAAGSKAAAVRVIEVLEADAEAKLARGLALQQQGRSGNPFDSIAGVPPCPKNPPCVDWSKCDPWDCPHDPGSLASHGVAPFRPRARVKS